MKTIFKIVSLVLILSLSSCDRPMEPTDYLDNRAPFLAFQGAPDVIFLTPDGDNTYEIFVGISTPIDNPISYTVTIDENSTAIEGTDFVFDSDFTIDSGDLNDSLIVDIDYDVIPQGVNPLLVNLSAEGDVQIGGNNQFDLTIIKP